MTALDSNHGPQPDPTVNGFRLSGVAIVTGAGSGIGRETALTFARSGVRAVTLADLDLESAKRVAEESKAVATNSQYDAFPFKVNVTDDEGMKEMVIKTVEKYGRVNYGVNCAGIPYSARAPISNYDAAELQLLHDVHVGGTLNFMKHVIHAMEKQEYIAAASPRGRSGTRHVGRGAIVNVSSLAGVIGRANIVQYCTAKAAVRSATKVAALEVGSRGIRVNCVAPSAVDGPMVDKVTIGAPDWKPALERATPLGRIAELEEVADAIVFLCSPLSSYLHGITLNIDGGMSIGTD